MVTGWHPILATVEQETGVWVMVDPTSKKYAIVRQLHRGGEFGYRAATWEERSKDRQLIGYYVNLRAATAAAHMRFISKHGVLGPVNGC